MRDFQRSISHHLQREDKRIAYFKLGLDPKKYKFRIRELLGVIPGIANERLISGYLERNRSLYDYRLTQKEAAMGFPYPVKKRLDSLKHSNFFRQVRAREELSDPEYLISFLGGLTKALEEIRK